MPATSGFLPALQTGKSVSDRAVFRASREAQTDRLLDGLAKLLVVDLRGDLRGLAEVLRRRRRGHVRNGHVFLRRERSRCEPHLLDPESLRDLRRAMTELEGPDRIGGRDVQRAVTRD